MTQQEYNERVTNIKTAIQLGVITKSEAAPLFRSVSAAYLTSAAKGV